MISQKDPKTAGVEHAYHFGNEFLVAPIVILNANSRQVYLPTGNWVDFWTSAAHAGGQTITWSSGNRMQFPLFLREGAIVPLLLENIQTLCDANYVNNAAINAAKQDLTFLIYPGSTTSQFTVYDGTQVQCESSGAASRVVTLNSIARPAMLQVFGDEPPVVTLNGSSLPKRVTVAEFEASGGWRFDVPTRFVFIKFPHAGGSAEVRF